MLLLRSGKTGRCLVSLLYDSDDTQVTRVEINRDGVWWQLTQEQ